eukprot:7323085-Lingulodinium_polyedra.AAC.1
MPPSLQETCLSPNLPLGPGSPCEAQASRPRWSQPAGPGCASAYRVTQAYARRSYRRRPRLEATISGADKGFD